MRAGGQEERQRAAGGGVITGGDGVEIDATEFQICLGGAVSEISGHCGAAASRGISYLPLQTCWVV